MHKTTFSLTFSRLLADRGRSTGWSLLAALFLLAGWCWWATRVPVTLYEVSSSARGTRCRHLAGPGAAARPSSQNPVAGGPVGAAGETFTLVPPNGITYKLDAVGNQKAAQLFRPLDKKARRVPVSVSGEMVRKTTNVNSITLIPERWEFRFGNDGIAPTALSGSSITERTPSHSRAAVVQ